MKMFCSLYSRRLNCRFVAALHGGNCPLHPEKSTGVVVPPADIPILPAHGNSAVSLAQFPPCS
jgi:hypothetical protein